MTGLFMEDKSGSFLDDMHDRYQEVGAAAAWLVGASVCVGCYLGVGCCSLVGAMLGVLPGCLLPRADFRPKA